MDRKEFLSLIGVSAAAFALEACLQGCTKVNQPNVDFTLNLADPAFAVLNTNGQYLYKEGVIIARSLTGSFFAVSQTCTHGGTSVIYESGKNDFFCQSHSAVFATSGAVTGGPANKNLKSYNTSLSGTNLHVWG